MYCKLGLETPNPNLPSPKNILDLGWYAKIVARVFLLLIILHLAFVCRHKMPVLRFNEKKGFGFIEPIDDAAKVIDKDHATDLTPGTS